MQRTFHALTFDRRGVAFRYGELCELGPRSSTSIVMYASGDFVRWRIAHQNSEQGMWSTVRRGGWWPYKPKARASQMAGRRSMSEQACCSNC